MTDQPDVNDLFPAKSTDELFPPEVARENYRRQQLGTSPVQDLIFGNTDVNPVARVLDHFGQGFKQSWGDTQENLSKETEEELKVNKQYDEWNKGRSSLVKAANDALFRPAAVQLVKEMHDAEAIGRAASGLFTGGQAAVAQIGAEFGAPSLGKEIAAIPEAFMGTPHPTGMPHPRIPDLPKAASLKVIGAGEDGYFGTAPSVEAAKPAAPAAGILPSIESVNPKVELEPGVSEPVVPVTAEVPAEPPQDIHAVARSLAPDTFSKYDALTTRQDTFRRWISELRDTRAEDVAKAAPHVEEIDGLQAKIDDPETTARLRKKYEERIAPLIEERDAHIADATQGDSPEMASIRQKLMELDYQRRDLAPEVTRAYRAADARMPKEAAPEVAAPIEAASPITPETAPEAAAKSPPDSVPAAAEKPVEPAYQPQQAVAPDVPIAVDVAKKLQAAGRPIEEAQAAGAIHAAYWETRAARFEGHKGTAAEMYAKEAPEIKAGKGVKPMGELALEPTTSVSPAKVELTAAELWDKIASDRQERRNTGGIQTGYNAETSKGGAKLRGKSSQVWEAGNTVDVGIVKNLLIAEKRADSSFALLSKPNEAGISRRYSFKQHEGISKDGEVDFKAATKDLIQGRELELNQRKGGAKIYRGEITLRKDAKSIITLFKDANASTAIHEVGHDWLDRLIKDAVDPQAPAGLIADSQATLKWLGVDKAADIKTRQHEKFARGFETYMMEGRAPSAALAKVFQQFKDWLTKIYNTVKALKAPISDDIRGVFDRMLAEKPEQTVIAPDHEPAKTFADIHEADAEHTPPEMAHPAAETIQAERDSVAARHLPEDNHARLKGTPDEARRGEAGNLQSEGDANAAGPVAGEAGNAEASGAVGQGGIEAAPSSPRAPARQAPPVEAFDKFPEKAGNIRLDNLNTPEDLNAIIRQTAEENGDFQNVRGPVSDAQVLDLAEAAGVDAAFIDSRKLGEAWTAPQIVALRRLLIQSAQSVHELAIKAAGGAEADVMAYAQAKARHMLIQERVSSVTAEAGRALRAFQSKFTEGVAGDVNAFLKEATGKTLFQLQQEAKFLSKLQTAGQTSRFVNDTNKGTFRNAILEYYINALISGPVTHSRYIVSNAVNALYTPLIEIPLASAFGKAREIITGEKVERVHLGEAGAQIYSMVKGSRDGLSAAIEAFKTGVSPALPKEQVSAHFAEASHAIPGTFGRVIRLPSRSVAGIHSFFKALRYEQNVQGLAFRAAETEGLTGDAFSNRVAELTTSPTEAMMTSATNDALKELYMSPTEYHSKMGGLVRFTNQNLAAKIVVPFMKIGSQITRNAFMERTPLGVLDKKVRENLSSGSPAADLQAGRIAGGVALMATSVGLCAEGMMTGDGPEDPATRAVWLLSHTPASIQIGDVSFKYGNTGPLGMLMRFAANTYETAHAMGDKDMGTLAVSFFEGFSKSVLDETFLRGVKDALDAMFHPKEYGAQYLKSQVTNWMPWSVGSSQVARKIDPFQRETHGIFQAAQAKIPWLSERLMPRRDMFGEPVPNGGPLPDYANDPVIKAMDSLHLGVGKIGKKIRGVDLTEQQYDDLARIAGRMAKTRLNAMVGIISNPNIAPGQRIEMIHTAISSSRETARSLIMMQNPDIVKQATDAKLAKLRGTETR